MKTPHHLLFPLPCSLLCCKNLRPPHTMGRWHLCFMLSFFFYFSSTLFHLCVAGDTITPTQPLADGKTIVSANGRFELGFFSPSSSSPPRRYLGIWFGKITTRTIVWVANRDKPIVEDTTGVLNVHGNGDLVLVNGSGTVFWSSSTTNTRSASKAPSARLEDTGDLVLRDDANTQDPILWHSFDHPTDTWLPGMTIGWNLSTRQERYLTSWRATDDPSPGEYTFRTDLQGLPRLVIRRESTVVARTGHWNGLYSSDGNITNNFYTVFAVSNQDDVYFVFQSANDSVLAKVVLNPSGIIQHSLWQDGTNRWEVYLSFPENKCDSYNSCGGNGVCINDSPFCGCLWGFETNLPQNLNIRDRSNRCVRRTPLECGKGSDGFLEVTGLKMPDTINSVVDMSKSLDQCKEVCLKNCSCTAYALADVKVGVGCIMWLGKLDDIQKYSRAVQQYYLRLAASELDNSHKKRKLATIIAPTLAGGVMLLFLAGCCLLKRKRKHGTFKLFRLDEWRGKEVQLPIFSFETIAAATGNFCNANKLGEGGFGPVYKGKLDDGQEIAVKRLSKDSLQGLDEFMNEITLIAKLQHRNLVRLLGCCVQRDERMLIYEYMPNRSLNAFIFDKEKCAMLDWKMRIDIILGIARGVLYLHQDSRLRIVHRDLKAGNILLDQGMNPKISDFGTARIFRADQVKDKTRTVVGTYGYMSPEYVINGIFSMKSDVFSFGVLVIEIMSGMKNRVVQNSDPPLTLLGYAWKLWNEGNISELLDKRMGLSCANSEVLRCIQIGLLCVQERSEDRPQMSSVGIMLGSDSTLLPRPKKPGFYTAISSNESDSSNSRLKSPSVGDVSLTVLEGR